MKTQKIPEELHTKLKIKAAQKGIPLQGLVEQILRKGLKDKESTALRADFLGTESAGGSE